jgi:ribA/ribD-fused uncharacterized protein
MTQKSPKTIDVFHGAWEFLSNFYPCTIHYNGNNFPTVEHAFQAAKSRDPMFWYKIKEIPAKDAGKAKRFGRSARLRSDWDIIKLSLMERFLMQKFSQAGLREELLSTEGCDLVEGNYWHDNYWGDCKCKKCISKEGQNHLGKLLMKVRGIIK